MLTQAVGYAAMAMAYLARTDDGAALVKTIAADCVIPGPYLSKIVNQLSRAGVIRTQRGVGGGARLAKAPADVTLYDLCEALHDPAIEKRCLLGVAECSDGRNCPAHAFNTERRDRLIAFLRSTTVADIATFEQNQHVTVRSMAEQAVGGSPIVSLTARAAPH